MRQSLTFDNDTTFALHNLIAGRLGMKTWFCDAHAFWQKGAVENANGRLRRCLPGQLDIDQMSDQDLRDIFITCNLKLQMYLGYTTPLQALFKEFGKTLNSDSLDPLYFAVDSRLRTY